MMCDTSIPPSWADVLALLHRIGEHENFGTKYCPLCKVREEKK